MLCGTFSGAPDPKHEVRAKRSQRAMEREVEESQKHLLLDRPK